MKSSFYPVLILRQKVAGRSKHNDKAIMEKAIAIAFIGVFLTEAIVIIIGNTFTIFVFWKQRFHLKRTCFLLISLAVADLLVGITEPVLLGTRKFQKNKSLGKKDGDIMSLSTAFQVLASSTSMFFLALISLERVFAVLYPLRHRVISTRPYICSVVITWATGFCMAAIFFLEAYHREVGRLYAAVVIHSCLSVSGLVICGSYLTIRTRLRSDFRMHNRNLTERNLRLSRTLFIIVGVSLLFWLPGFVAYVLREFCWECVSLPIAATVNVLRLANSMVNPFVYSFKMPMFKNAFKKRRRKYGRTNELRAVGANISSEETGLYYPSSCSLVQYKRNLSNE